MVDSNTKQSFADAGIAHILALSGLHLGIIAAILAAILLPLNLVIHYKYRFIILIILYGHSLYSQGRYRPQLGVRDGDRLLLRTDSRTSAFTLQFSERGGSRNLGHQAL